MSNIEELSKIFEENIEKRICVLGTTCTGKTTLIKSVGIGLDMDKEIFPLLTKEETDYVCQTPWTEEIGNKMDELVRTRLSIKPGTPMFGTVLLDCDLIVYLHINDELLLERTKLRNTDFMNAKNMQQKIEEEIKKSNIPAIYVEVQNENKKVK
ncbi:MAG: hypothetical protein J6D28_05480 [Bacilli bacterium]|nr:hypothetical protein [Bacilli bacterium]